MVVAGVEILTVNSLPKVRWHRRLWRLLMTPVGKRVRVGRHQAPHGSVAILSVLVGLMLMSSVVTDMGYNEIVRYKLAAHDRDALKAQALAESGLNLARLVLAAQSAIQPCLTMAAKLGIPLPAHTVWEILPIDCETIRSVTTGELQTAVGMPMDQVLAAQAEAHIAAEDQAKTDFDVEKEGAGNAPFVRPKGGFGEFDGSCTAAIEDEEKRAVSLRDWDESIAGNDRFAFAKRLYDLVQAPRYDFLFEDRDITGNRSDRYEWVANIYDWIDKNEDATDPIAEPTTWGQGGGGSEDALYTAYSVEPRNEYFDSHDELRLVRGMTDAHMKAFGDSISIYGKKEINILSAPASSVEFLVRACAANPDDPLLTNTEWMTATVNGWMQCKSMGMASPECMTALGGAGISPEGFVAYLSSGMASDGTVMVINADLCKKNVGTESENFTIKSTGTVGDVQRTITLVLRMFRATEERYYYSIVK
jgi:Type II secretion system (T2SS), protein K